MQIKKQSRAAFVRLEAALISALGQGGYTIDSAGEGLEIAVSDSAQAGRLDAVVQAHVAAADVLEANAAIQSKIAELEAAQTPRLVREVVLGIRESVTTLTAVQEQIVKLRAQLQEA